MACLNMFNNEQHYNTMGPRISFSNDFADSQQPIKLENSYREAPVSSEFEFFVPNNTMISADQLFFKGKMVPLRENCAKTTTLRDELLNGGDDYEDVSPRLAKGTSRWKEMLGLKRSHVVVPKKSDKNGDGSLESIDEMKISEGVSNADFVGLEEEDVFLLLLMLEKLM
ncbi:hypothetical protein DH2020_029342 [Rehmannia glutinosa]|uniref:Uncharacterized protein n=1 Tax=Rehmannia glutinosa TaxID=99300 RepID=A0ABR0VPK1_REHGL